MLAAERRSSRRSERSQRSHSNAYSNAPSHSWSQCQSLQRNLSKVHSNGYTESGLEFQQQSGVDDQRPQELHRADQQFQPDFVPVESPCDAVPIYEPDLGFTGAGSCHQLNGYAFLQRESDSNAPVGMSHNNFEEHVDQLKGQSEMSEQFYTEPAVESSEYTIGLQTVEYSAPTTSEVYCPDVMSNCLAETMTFDGAQNHLSIFEEPADAAHLSDRNAMHNRSHGVDSDVAPGMTDFEGQENLSHSETDLRDNFELPSENLYVQTSEQDYHMTASPQNPTDRALNSSSVPSEDPEQRAIQTDFASESFKKDRTEPINNEQFEVSHYLMSTVDNQHIATSQNCCDETNIFESQQNYIDGTLNHQYAVEFQDGVQNGSVTEMDSLSVQVEHNSAMNGYKWENEGSAMQQSINCRESEMSTKLNLSAESPDSSVLPECLLMENLGMNDPPAGLRELNQETRLGGRRREEEKSDLNLIGVQLTELLKKLQESDREIVEEFKRIAQAVSFFNPKSFMYLMLH